MTSNPPITDSFGRVHTSLRIGVTDRCNIRCTYCMPEFVRFLPRPQVLTFEEIERVVSIVGAMGVNKIRLTGGEPLVRAELWRLIAMLKSIEGIDEVALTTNGILLSDQAQQLKDAGLDRINVSLDTVDADVFKKLTRRDGLEKVFAGIEAAQQVGFDKLRLNAVSVRGITDQEIVPLVHFARDHHLELRFIEFMPFDAGGDWDDSQVLSGSDVKSIIENRIGKLEPVERKDDSQPAVDFRFVDGQGSVGFINSVTEPFCASCNRMRLTAEGKFRNCLFSDAEWDVRNLLRHGASNEQIAELMRNCVAAKKAGHGMDRDDFQRSNKAMYQIGG